MSLSLENRKAKLCTFILRPPSCVMRRLIARSHNYAYFQLDRPNTHTHVYSIVGQMDGE